MDTTLILNFMAAMIAIVNPIGALPVFISYTEGERKHVQQWLAIFVALTVLVLLTLFLLIGAGILKFFGITIAAFRIAGGILLLLTGISMVHGGQTKRTQELIEQAQFDDFKEAKLVYQKILVPFCVPLLIGPGSISTVILYGSHAHDEFTLLGFIGVIVLMALLVLLTLLTVGATRRMLGQIGLEVITRLLGMVLAAIGMQFILNGLADAAPNLIHPALG